MVAQPVRKDFGRALIKRVDWAMRLKIHSSVL